MTSHSDIIHNENGDLTILKEWLEPYPYSGRPNYCETTSLVLCFCGKEFTTKKKRLNNGKTKSCGCYNLKRIQETNTIHSHAIRGKYSQTYISWINLKQACFNKNNTKYPRQGDRGITVCDEWLSFKEFLKDIGVKPPHHKLNRINKDGDYEPDNCEWVPINKKKGKQ